jgi:hypothetical protein
MLNNKDIICKNLKVINDKEVSIINNYDEDYLFSSLTVEGGGVFKKGISIGMQEKMVSGLIIYDTENFYGFSEKYGLVLLSTHPEYIDLEIPNNTFIENKLQPVSNNDTFKNAIETEKTKNLNIDIQLKDNNNFFLTIPSSYNNNNFNIHFYIKYIYDLNTIITNLNLCIINQSNKITNFNIVNNNCFFNNFNNNIQPLSIKKICLEIINEEYFLINTFDYFTNS